MIFTAPPRRLQGVFVPFQCLKWRNGDCYADHSATARFGGAVRDSEAEAVHALLALGGYDCVACGKHLEKRRGYVCCDLAHCPYCGRSCCRHFLAEDGPHSLTLYVPHERYSEPVSPEEMAAFLKLWELLPPARRLPTQSGPGCPVWWPKQRQQAYSAWVLPHIEAIFGPDLRTFREERTEEIIISACLRPDVKTMRNSRTTCYYHAYPDASWNRAERFLIELAEGTERLRAMRPHRMVRMG